VQLNEWEEGENMTYEVKSRPMGLLGGTIVAIALLLSPVASATGSKHSHHGASHAVHFACRHCHHQFASEGSRTSLRSQRHGHRVFAMANRGQTAGAWRRERVYGQHHWHNAGTVQARYQPYNAAIQTRREESRAENEHDGGVTARLNLDQLRKGRERDAEIAQWAEHEAPVTAQLNLDQLRKGRERDAEIAQWHSQYDTTAKGT
jgi:hypothetical protein